MAAASKKEVVVTTRIRKALYAKLVKKQDELKKSTGIRPSASALVNALLESALTENTSKRAVA